MKPLSQQLEDLAQRTKNIEDAASATREKNKAKLERRGEQLKSEIESTSQKLEASAAEAKGNIRSGWNDIKRRIDERMADARTKIEERKAERDLNKAERRAQAAEEDAADTIAFAVYVLDQAEYAAVNAVLARADADNLRAAA